jgi:hypothetical protein
MATTFDTENEAQAMAAELNAVAGRDVRYNVERCGEKWAIARRSKRTYWGWDEYVDHVPPTPAQKSDVETVRQIVHLALSDGMEIAVLMALLRSQNEGDAFAKLKAANAGEAGVFVRNSLFAWLIVKIAREFAGNTRDGDLHLGRAFELLTGDTFAILRDVGSADDIDAAINQFSKLRGDQRLKSLIEFRNKKTAHLGTSNDNIPSALYGDVFALGEATIDVVDSLAKGIGVAKHKIREEVAARLMADKFWKPWKDS